MQCKLCKKEIPEGSIFCMYCGKKQITTPRKQKGRGNGQGTVYQLPNGKWRAVVTLGYIDGKRKTRAKTFDKKADAVMYLPELAKQTKMQSNMTLKECFDVFMSHHEKEISSITRRNYNSGIKKLEPLHHIKMIDLKLDIMQSCFDNMDMKNSSKRNIKSLLCLLFDYAIKNDILQKDYAQYIQVGKNDATERNAFTSEDLLKIKALADEGNIYAMYIMCMCFTGFRVGEFFAIKKTDYYDGCLHGGSKTNAGKNRVVPVNDIIKPYIDKRMNNFSEYLFPSVSGKKIGTSNFSNIYFPNTLKECGIPEGKFVPHSCRHTFATLCNKTNSNDFVARKRLIGHTDLKTTERYTHSDIEDMRQLINQLTI